MLGCCSMRALSRLAIASTTSFSRLPEAPMAPGSSPPWPGSSAMVIIRVSLGGGSSGCSDFAICGSLARGLG
jgi:hypothetical protein